MNQVETKVKSLILSEFINKLSFQEIPTAITEKATRHILDSLGATIAGAISPETEILTRTLLANTVNGSATLVGQENTASPLAAALINGTAAHAFELDDTGGCDHSGAVVVPAALAAVEAASRPVSGQEFITAVVLGYDLARRALEACGAYEAHNGVGFHSTGTCGPFGAAAACAKILQLSVHETQMALGLASSFSSGLWACVHDGAQNKRLHAGHAAFGGLLSALLAKQGFTGPSMVFEEVWGGFHNSFAPQTFNSFAWLEDLGSNWKLSRVSIKPHASCRSTHSVIDAVDWLIDQHKFVIADIKEIVVLINPFVHKMCGNFSVSPQNAAQMSIPYSIAADLLYGSVTLPNFTKLKRENAQIQNIMELIRFEVDETQADDTEPTVCIHLTNGKILEKQVPVPLGSPTNPISDKLLFQKFRAVSQMVLPSEKVEELIQSVLKLSSIDDCRLALIQPTRYPHTRKRFDS